MKGLPLKAGPFPLLSQGKGSGSPEGPPLARLEGGFRREAFSLTVPIVCDNGLFVRTPANSGIGVAQAVCYNPRAVHWLCRDTRHHVLPD
jgi:hypothetical protein